MVLQEHIEPFRLKQMLLIHVKTSNVILSVSIHSEGERRVFLSYNKLLDDVGIKNTNSPGATEN